MSESKNNKKTVGSTLQSSFQEFFKSSTSAGIVILVATAVALIWINSPLHDSYEGLIHAPVKFLFGSLAFDFSVEMFVNDALMAIFFMIVGLEIKRELILGELSTIKRAMLPIVGAAFGMLVPALIYVGFNAGTPAIRGWGVPVATDIAFALGVLALLGKRVPLGLKVFLAALAIVDDLLSVLVIAVFYTNSIDMTMILWSIILIGVLYLGNRLGVHNIRYYIVFGIALWVTVFFSGVHATIAGVALAMTIPARPRLDPGTFFTYAQNLALDIMKRPYRDLDEASQADAVYALEKVAERVQSPLSRIEHAMQPYVSFLIMPLFALVNSGVVVDFSMVNSLTTPVSLGISVGLFVGKQVGVSLAAWISIRLGWAELPTGTNMRQIYGVALLCGIGFTMALFVAHLAFVDPHDLNVAKLSILAGSVLSAVFGALVLRSGLQSKTILS